MFRIIIVTLLMAISGALYADCTSDGQTYPEGKRVGPYVCEGGKWIRK